MRPDYCPLGGEPCQSLCDTPCTKTPQRKPLTSAEIRKWWASENGLEDCDMSKLDDFEKVVRAVEGKHNIKENT